LRRVRNRIPSAAKGGILWGVNVRAEQLAAKVLQRRNYREGLLQGLKPDADWIGFIGPTKVVPLLQNL